MNRRCFKKLNDKGVSLVELLIVIAIMSILAGGAGIGISLVFSKDAANCATRLNDAINKARMDSMSKTVKYELIIGKNAGGLNIAEIKNATDDTSEIIYLDGDATSVKTEIAPSLIDSTGTSNPLTLPVTIEFDKAKGNVKVGSGSINSGGIISFDISALRGTKKSNVQLITATGKHAVGGF